MQCMDRDGHENQNVYGWREWKCADESEPMAK